MPAACVLLATAVLTAVAISRKPDAPAHPASPPPAAHPAKPLTLTFAAMGDMIAHDSIVRQAQKADSYDFKSYFSSIRPLYSHRDVVFCNPETPVAGQAVGISGYPTFNAPTEFARDLRDESGAGCKVINLATNHINDKGQAGIDLSVNAWDQLSPLAFAGANRSAAERDEVRYFTKNGIKIAFAAFMDFSNAKLTNDYGVETYHDEARVRQKLSEARSRADAVIVSAHWGTEDSTAVNNDQRAAAKLFNDLGADVVIGTGPHVLQPVDEIIRSDGHRTLVWYSIGNMLSSQLQINELTGILAGFTIQKSNNRIVISELEAVPTFMSYDWPTADRAAERLDTRTNFQLQPMYEADRNIQKMFPGESAASRQEFVRKTLGEKISLVEHLPAAEN